MKRSPDMTSEERIEEIKISLSFARHELENCGIPARVSFMPHVLDALDMLTKEIEASRTHIAALAHLNAPHL